MTHVTDYVTAMSELYDDEIPHAEWEREARDLLDAPDTATKHAYSLLLKADATDDKPNAKRLRTAGMALLAAVVEGDV